MKQPLIFVVIEKVSETELRRFNTFDSTLLSSTSKVFVHRAKRSTEGGQPAKVSGAAPIHTRLAINRILLYPTANNLYSSQICRFKVFEV